jgi:uncharacterized protein
MSKNYAQPGTNIYIKDSAIPGGGRGVFAARTIKKGEIIESCPFIEISEIQFDPVLVTYIFYFGKNLHHAALALGCGSLYNHSHFPNANFRIRPKEQMLVFTAITNISRNQEITFNYHHSRNPKLLKKPLWFEV